MKKKGLFIVLEGTDRAGKSTHTARLVKHLKKQGLKVVFTREPGGTRFAESIRKLLLDPKHKIVPLAELLLYEASRAQNTQEKIIPALEKNKIVICERYSMSSIAYQGYGRGIPIETVKKLNKIATNGLKPDLTVIFDMPYSDYKLRDKKFKSDRLELESQKFRKRVRGGYLLLVKKTPNAFLVNTGKPIAKVQKIIREKIQTVLKKNEFY